LTRARVNSAEPVVERTTAFDAKTVALRRLWWNRSILPVGRRADSGVSVRDAVLAADPVEQDLHGQGTEAAREDLAVVGQDLIGDTVAVQRCCEDGLPDEPTSCSSARTRASR